jgi:Major Facilitator Superfamily
MGLTAALRGPFGLLWAGQTLSLLGDFVFLVAFTWQLAAQWQQPTLLGLLWSVRVLAEVATAGVGGWIIDRIARRTVVLAADAGRGLLLFALAAALHRPAPVLALALLMVGYGILTALFRPALVAYLPELVQSDRLAAANALYGVSQRTSMVVGPLLGTVLVGFGSAPVALRLNGLSFLLAAATTLLLPAGSPAAGASRGLAHVVEGFRVARRVGWVGGTIVIIAVANLGTITAERLALPCAAADRYGKLGGYGAIVVAIAAGAVLASIAIGRARPLRDPGRVVYTAALLLGAATLGFGLARGIVAAVLIGLAFGAGQQTAHLLWITSLQHNTPDRLRGRVAAVADFGSFVFLPVSFAVGGLVVQAAGPQLVLLAAGANGMLAATIGLAVPALHRWRPFDDALVAVAARQRDPRSASLPEGQTS